MCNRLQTVCEQSATVFASRDGVQQFVNKVQQIVIAATSEDGSQAAQNPVVEHKGWDASFGFLMVFFVHPVVVVPGCVSVAVHPVRDAPRFCDSGVPNCLRHPLTS